jgi:DNA (cytosine-5)-methyltransferase 1
LKFGSLFSGIGGIDLGLERAGMTCRWQIEIDDYARQVLAKHWPDVPRYSDITEVDGRVLEPVDLIAGGFPCQDISYAGRGAGLDGERSGLFWETVRVVRQCQPRYVLLENVAALLTRGLDRVLGTLAEIGYDTEWHCIPAAALGAPHIRDRVFVVAYADDAGSRTPRCGTDGLWSATEDTGKQESQPELGGYGEDMADTEQMGRTKRRGNEGNEGRTGQRWSQPGARGWWAIEPDVGRVAHGVPKRVDRLRGLGNSVVPQVAEFIGRQIMGEDE